MRKVVAFSDFFSHSCLFLASIPMVSATANGTKKRKHAVDEDESSQQQDLPEKIGLELQSDESDEEEVSEGEVEDFPELDGRSDTTEDGEEDSEEEGETDENEDEDEEEESSEGYSEGTSDDEIRVFPKAKVITSEITGQPKKVYPEIEPEYDSDSSTEDVCMSCSTSGSLSNNVTTESQSCRKHPNALV